MQIGVCHFPLNSLKPLDVMVVILGIGSSRKVFVKGYLVKNDTKQLAAKNLTLFELRLVYGPR
jgi:hypothetical protein